LSSPIRNRPVLTSKSSNQLLYELLLALEGSDSFAIRLPYSQGKGFLVLSEGESIWVLQQGWTMWRR